VESLLAFFQRRTHDAETAADLTAETFVAALVARGSYEARATPAAAWLFAIAHHKPTDFGRRASRRHARAARGGGRARCVVSIGDDDRLVISAPPESRAEVDALTQPGRLALYDWEPSVLGPDGEPAPRDASVTGGDGAGIDAATTRAEAEARAAAAGPGARVVRAEAGPGQGWFALGGEPAMTGDEVASAEPTVDAASGTPAVALELTARGRTLFGALTREVAMRGDSERANQHFAMVIDDRIVAVPFIDYRQAPDGIDGAGAPRSPAG
jgi:DNA-directed RNA polymerase specialized sigma24 family protein